MSSAPDQRVIKGLNLIEPVRLNGTQRRNALLDVAAEMVAQGHVDDVSMETIALGAQVSRALVYKHFANRLDLITALYLRESTLLHVELSAEVARANTFEDKLRVLVRGALRAQAVRGATFAALQTAGGRTASHRDVRRRRDGQTLRHFTQIAVANYGLEESVARSGVGLVLGAISSVLIAWQNQPSSKSATRLENDFVTMSVGGLVALAERSTR